MDALAPVLAQFRYRPDLYCLLEGAGRWGLRIPKIGATAYVHCVRRGRCVARLGEEVVPLQAGDLVLLPHGDEHELLAEEGDRAQPLRLNELVERRERRGDRVYTVGKGSVRTEMVCGGYAFDDNGFNPVLDFLPPLVHLSAATAAEPRMEAIIGAAARELAGPGPGSSLALERLAELLLILALRSSVEAIGDGDRGWLHGLRDPATAAALHAIHTAPEQAWTLERLADRAAVSRSTLGSRFRAHLGMPPGQYLSRWRMRKAASYLTGTSLSLAEIAARVGYASDVAFNKAFKAEFGVPPGEFRRERSLADDG